MLGGDEQLLAEVSRLRGAVGEQLEHALHHLLGILSDQLLRLWTHLYITELNVKSHF